MPRLSLSLAAAILAITPVTLAAPKAQAQSQQAQVIRGSALLQMVQIEPLVDMISNEGLLSSADLERDMFPGRGGMGWQREVRRIYEAGRLLDLVVQDWPGGMSDEDLSTLEAFYGGDLGTRFIEAEIKVRGDMIDTAISDAAKAAGRAMRAENDPRITLLTEFIESYDLLTQNVVGGMNSNFAFYQGLESGGGLPDGMTESEMLRQVYSQEPEIREEMEDWLYGYLAVAYSGFSDDELRTYIAFADTQAAQSFNTVIFEGFNRLFETVSRDLGRAVAGYMVAEDI